MVLEDSIRVIWKKCFLQMVQLDAFVIGCAYQFLSTPRNINPVSFEFNSNDYKKHISDVIEYYHVATAPTQPNPDVIIPPALYYFPITSDNGTTGVPAINNALIPVPTLEYYNSYRTGIFLQEFIAPILLFTETYKNEKEDFKDFISYIYKNEKSTEIIRIMELLFRTIGAYPLNIVTPEDQKTEDEKTVVKNSPTPNGLFTTRVTPPAAIWDPASWAPLDPTHPTPHMDAELRTCIQELQQILLIGGIHFDQSLSSFFIRSWYDFFYSKAASTDVMDFLESEIPKFAEYFASAKPTTGASEYFNPAVLYIKDFVTKANSRGTLDLIKSRSIPSVLKLFRRLNFVAPNEISTKKASDPYDYHLIYLLIKGPSRLAEIFAEIPSQIYDIDSTGLAASIINKPNIPTAIDLNNLFPGELTTSIISRSIDSEYKNHLKFIDLLYKSLQKPYTLRNEITKLDKRGMMERMI